MRYILQPGVVLASVCDEQLLVATGDARGKVPYVKGINKPGAYFWNLLEQNLREEEIIRRAMADYGASEEIAREALRKFTGTLAENGYLTIEQE